MQSCKPIVFCKSCHDGKELQLQQVSAGNTWWAFQLDHVISNLASTLSPGCLWYLLSRHEC